MTRHLVATEAAMIALGQKLSKRFLPGTVLVLEGDLGAGKTHLVKGIAKGLGVDDIVTSPTFALVQRYRGTKGNLTHADLYRIKDAEHLESLGLAEVIEEGKDVVAIEWPELLKKQLPKRVITIKIKHTAGGREVCVR